MKLLRKSLLVIGIVFLVLLVPAGFKEFIFGIVRKDIGGAMGGLVAFGLGWFGTKACVKKFKTI